MRALYNRAIRFITTLKGFMFCAMVGVAALVFLGATLFVATLLMNLVSIRLVRRFREVYD